MAYWIRHKFTSAKGDGTNTTLVKPSNWNDDHDFWMDEGTIIARPPGSGPGPGVEVPISMLFPSGMVTPFAGGTPPTGWLLCNGASLLRADYPTLFAVIGGIYGAADATHFSVPDLRGRVVAGVDGGVGRLTGTTINLPSNLNGVGGQETEQAYADISAAGRSYGYTDSALSVHVAFNTGNQSNGVYGLQFGGGGMAAADHYHYADGWFNTQGQAHLYADGTYYGGGYTRAVSNVQPTILLNYMIKT